MIKQFIKPGQQSLFNSYKGNYFGIARYFSEQSSSASSFSSVDPKETETFSKVDDWWDPLGSQRGLHAYNYARINYMKRMVLQHSNKEVQSQTRVFKGFDMLDVGCGPGLLCESLARLGGNVQGIDSTPACIGIAEEHASRDPFLRNSLQYQNISSEELVQNGKQFDIVSSVEVIEHVTDPNFFVKQIADLTKDDGLIFLSTINKTLQAYLVVILGAEYISRVIPQGTHDYNKFIKPEELRAILGQQGLNVIDTQGFQYNPIKNEIYESSDDSINYFITASKSL